MSERSDRIVDQWLAQLGQPGVAERDVMAGIQSRIAEMTPHEVSAIWGGAQRSLLPAALIFDRMRELKNEVVQRIPPWQPPPRERRSRELPDWLRRLRAGYNTAEDLAEKTWDGVEYVYDNTLAGNTVYAGGEGTFVVGDFGGEIEGGAYFTFPDREEGVPLDVGVYGGSAWSDPLSDNVEAAGLDVGIEGHGGFVRGPASTSLSGKTLNVNMEAGQFGGVPLGASVKIAVQGGDIELDIDALRDAYERGEVEILGVEGGVSLGAGGSVTVTDNRHISFPDIFRNYILPAFRRGQRIWVKDTTGQVGQMRGSVE